MQFDRDKFKVLVHYIIWKVGKRDRFGATKLNKVLWFTDARAFVLTGKPITGATYIREKWGPVPKQMMPIRAEMEREGLIRIINSRGDYDHTKFTTLTAPDLSLLTEFEKETVNYWIKHIDENHTAASISEQSHDFGWEIAAMGEELPLHAFLAARIRDLTPAELGKVRARAKELGLG
jgi:hypothetical protein